MSLELKGDLSAKVRICQLSKTIDTGCDYLESEYRNIKESKDLALQHLQDEKNEMMEETTNEEER